MTDTELKRRKAICDVAGIDDIGDLSDGFHTFNGLYEQRLILFAALVKAYKDKAWKSYRHEDGELCFGGGWFIVGIDTPEGSYTYHYENKYWNMFDCVNLPRAKHWDGHTEDDAETRLMSLEPEQKKDEWIPCNKRLPENDEYVLATTAWEDVTMAERLDDTYWYIHEGYTNATIDDVVAWMPKPEPYRGEQV